MAKLIRGKEPESKEYRGADRAAGGLKMSAFLPPPEPTGTRLTPK